MENYKGVDQSNINSININNPNYPIIQNKILRSKSKNIYNSQKQNKPKINPNAYTKPKIPQNNGNLNNKKEINNINFDNYNNNRIPKNNYQNEQKSKKSDLIQIKLLQQENEALKRANNHQDEILKELHNLFIHNYNKIKTLKKNYYSLKKFLENSLFDDENNNELKEKMEEELALRAVEQRIMDEICPNPDKMSYEQLLELEEEVGNVNKGLTKDKINKIPVKPFHKALFEDNSQCIICMENFNENELVKQLPCGHIFHGDCIDHWLIQQKNCPFCKSECFIGH